ncbi:MAG: hypothetical protein IT337_12430 [Thermomicrobiales bacterium]|nr:hypothetical protein [Thermomicrobiales bacterium]
MSKQITRISDGPVGDRLWWFGNYQRIRKVPAGYSSSGRDEFWVDLLATPTIFFHRSIRCQSWNHARHVMSDPASH